MAVFLNALATGTPPHRISQDDVRRRISALIEGGMSRAMARLYETSDIETRNIAQPADDYLKGQDWGEKNAVYLERGQKLLEEVTAEALRRAGLAPVDIDVIACVSTTGIATPSLPSQMLATMGFRGDVLSVPLFGYGCAGGVSGLEVARDLAAARPGRKVLLLTLELCSLAFRPGAIDKKAIIASTLFGDGASACVLGSEGPGPRLGAFYGITWPKTREMMGWEVDELGFGLVLSPAIPGHVARCFAPEIAAFLEREGLALSSLPEPACHPGGRKVIEALEAVFDHLPGGLPATRAVFRDHGNMSAPTVHFVLERILAGDEQGPILMTALGPGFTGALGLLER